MFGFLKERISAEEAAAMYINIVLQVIKKSWVLDIRSLNELFQKEILDEEDVMAPFELFLAVASLELLAVENLAPEKYNIIYQSILQILSGYENYGDYSVNNIEMHYMPELRHSLRNNYSPLDAVIYILFQKLELDHNPLTSVFFQEMIMKKIGTWKALLKKFNIT